VIDKAGDRGTELKDLSLDSGPAHLRGQAMVSAEGHLEKAELSAFKLSPGDDMRVVLDRTANGYRVQVRGNVADVTVRFVTDQINMTTGRDGEVVTGSDAVTELTDLWTFQRDLTSGDSTWKLVGTGSQ